MYSERLGKKFYEVENVPINYGHSYEMTDEKKSVSSSNPVQFVYHGNSGKGRGLFHVLFAFSQTTGDSNLNLVLTGSDFTKWVLMVYSKMLSLDSRVVFWPRVEPERVTSFLRKFDVAIIFFPPPHSSSINYSLPNKFFESIAAGLGIIVGPNPSMSRIVLQSGCGIVLGDWSIKNLANELSLPANMESIATWKSKSAVAAKQFSSDDVMGRFLNSAIGVAGS
jgi:glycosyltransferase involved in cell wall biosynthesis